MKHESLIGRGKVYLCLFILFCAPGLFAQDITLSWTAEVGCQAITPPDGDPDRKYEELIEKQECLRVCEFTEVTYALDTNDSSTWLSTVWSVTGGTIVSQTIGTCIVTWGSSGSGSIGATVMTSGGPASVRELCVEIIKGPDARFGVLPNTSVKIIEACRNQDLYFINLSDAAGGTEIISYSWDFADGTFSSEANPVHSFSHSGEYIVTLQVKNACKCVSTYSVVIKVRAQGVNIICPGVICNGGIETYELDTDIGDCIMMRPGVHYWTVSGGTILIQSPTSVTVQWNHIGSSGFGTLSFDATGCEVECSEITSIRIPVITEFARIQGPWDACIREQYRYTLPKWPSTEVEWNIDTATNAELILTDQPNEVIVNTKEPGVIALTAAYRNTFLHCGGISETVFIRVAPPIAILGPQKACTGDSGFGVYPSIPADWEITDSAGNPVGSYLGAAEMHHTFSTPGSYTITPTVPGYCVSTPFKVQILPEPGPVNPIDVLGKRTVCVGVPESYRFTNTVPGSVIGWAVAGGTANGAFAGSNYGNEVTVVFANAAGPFKLLVWRENNQSPYCRSEVAEIEIKRPVLDLSIIAGDAIQGATPCPSTYQDYAVKTALGDLYTEGEVYNWTIEDPDAGSVTAVDGLPESGDGTPNISILWNQFSTTVNTRIILQVRKCNSFSGPFYFPVTINAVPDFEIEVPETICSSQSFNPSINPGGAGDVVWYVDGAKVETAYVRIYNSSSGNQEHELKAVINSVNGCPIGTVVTKAITVNGIPSGRLSPAGPHRFCSTVTPFDLTLSSQPSGTTITWMKNEIAVSPQPVNPNIYTVTDFGLYNVELSYGGCTVITNWVRVESQNCGPSPEPCIISPPPVVTLAAVPFGCGKFKATATAPGAIANSHDWYATGNCDDCHAIQESGSTMTEAVYSCTEPDLYTVSYTVAYLSTEGEPCMAYRDVDVIVPYIAALDTKISCGPSSNYAVQLLDRSRAYPLTPIEEWEYYVNGISQGVQSSGAKTLYLAPGTYTLKIRIRNTTDPLDYDSCFEETEIVLPDLPDAAFTFTSNTCTTGCGTVCQNKSLHFTITNPLPEQTYLWDFGTSQNIQQDPDKVFATAGPYDASVTVTNKYGCTATYSVPIEVQSNTLGGRVNIAPNPIVCEGFPITLTYEALPDTQLATHFIWMNGHNQVSLIDAPSINVEHSGAYWVKTTDTYGCTSQTGTENATFVMVPDVELIMPTGACVGEPFSMEGYGGGTGTLYEWFINGISQTSFENANTKFTYTHTMANEVVTVKLRTGVSQGGILCESFLEKTIYVYAPPAEPTVSIVEVVSCSPYVVRLKAESGTIGTFNWSNGSSTLNSTESEVDVTEGGPYRVTFMNPGEGGCSASAQIEVPKDPETFLWLFPTGCYTFCKDAEDTQRVLLAPRTSVTAWLWDNLDDPGFSVSGTGIVEDYIVLDTTGPYQLTLTNGDCAKSSGLLEYTKDTCRNCDFAASIEGIDPGYLGFCSYAIYMSLTNADAFNVTVGLSSNEGFFIPYNTDLPPGTTSALMIFVPGTGFAGGPITITFTINSPEGRCVYTDTFELPPCFEDEEEQERIAAPGGGKMTGSLVIAPNPAGNSVQLAYDIPLPESSGAEIAIYDLSGRMLGSQTVSPGTGSWEVDTSRYASGTYIVVLRLGGHIVQQKKLVVK